MKKIVNLFTLSLMLTACSVEKKNDEMHQFVAEQEHDERLFGWWQSIKNPSSYVFYDVSFYILLATADDSGIITLPEKCWYWYTKDMWRYLIRDTTPLTGLIDSCIEYRLSDDNEYIQEEINGVFTNILKRVHDELQLVE